MNIAKDGAITLTKREREALHDTPLLVRHIALHHPELDEDAVRVEAGCKKILATIGEPIK